MKLGIVGSRTFNDYALLERTILHMYKLDDITCIVSGGARGADTLGERFAHEYGVPTSIRVPQWEKLGRRAGYVRDTEIVAESDEIVAFWDGRSPGTKMTISLAKQAGKKITVVFH